MSPQKEIIAVGSIALDHVETAFETRTEVLGGSAIYFGLSSANFTSVHLVGVIGHDFPQEAIELLRRHNVYMTGVESRPGATFRWGGRYNRDFTHRHTLFTHLGVFADFHPSAGKNFPSNSVLYLGNIQPILQLELLDQVSSAELTIADTMNLWIANDNDTLWQVIRRVDLFLLNDEEARQLTNTQSLQDAARMILDNGPRAVVIKMGACGATLFENNSSCFVPIYKVPNVVDPTGAGDTFAGGFTGHIACCGADNLVDAVITGAAVASFTVSDFSMDGVLTATPERIEKRRAIIQQKMTDDKKYK